jgi:hypothetical protein
MIRFIMNGRLLNDQDQILQLKVDTKSNIQAFISPRIGLPEDGTKEATQKPPEPTKEDDKDKPVNIADALNGQRGFDYFKINGYTVRTANPRTRRSSGSATYSMQTS